MGGGVDEGVVLTVTAAFSFVEPVSGQRLSGSLCFGVAAPGFVTYFGVKNLYSFPKMKRGELKNVYFSECMCLRSQCKGY